MDDTILLLEILLILPSISNLQYGTYQQKHNIIKKCMKMTTKLI